MCDHRSLLASSVREAPALRTPRRDGRVHCGVGLKPSSSYKNSEVRHHHGFTRSRIWTCGRNNFRMILDCLYKDL